LLEYKNNILLHHKPKDKEMKKVFFLVGFSIPILLSMTFNEAQKKTGANPQIVYSVPIKPKSTLIVDSYDLREYLKKGYQVQNMVYTSQGHMFLLMVKY
jgi:hypothetical protein